jgi:putative phage-type endonuclease
MKIADRVEAVGKCVLIGQFPAGSPEWLEQRESGIGGSEIASILNLSPYKSAVTLFYEKLGLIDPPPATMAMRLGNLLEPAIIDAFREEYPTITVWHENLTFASLENPRFRANPDAIIEDQNGNLSILEIKHTGQYWTELPLHYKYQVLWYMFVTGLTNPATLYAVTGGSVRAFTVEWDETLMEVVKSAVTAFCALLDAEQPPTYDGSDSTYQTIRELSPGIRDEEVELSCGLELMAAKQLFDGAERNLQKYKAMALDELDGARVGLYNGNPIVILQARGEGKPYITFTKGN